MLAGDSLSKVLDPDNPNLEALFGDAGTATAINYLKSKNINNYFSLNTDGSKYEKLIVKKTNNKTKNIYIWTVKQYLTFQLMKYQNK